MMREEARARTRKVLLLVDEARRRGIDARTAKFLDIPGQNALAGLAHVRSPSAETWRQVVECLESAERDPFGRIG